MTDEQQEPILLVPGTTTKHTLDEWVTSLVNMIDEYALTTAGEETQEANDAVLFLASLPESLVPPSPVEDVPTDDPHDLRGGYRRHLLIEIEALKRDRDAMAELVHECIGWDEEAIDGTQLADAIAKYRKSQGIYPFTPSTDGDSVSMNGENVDRAIDLRKEIMRTLAELQDGASAKGDEDLANIAEWFVSKIGLILSAPTGDDEMPEHISGAIEQVRQMKKFGDPLTMGEQALLYVLDCPSPSRPAGGETHG